MPAGWNITDDPLRAMLDAVRVAFLNNDRVFTVDLFKNDYTPVNGMTSGDLITADFDGYSQQTLDMNTWEAVVVTDHVAITTNTDTVTFLSSSSASSQTIYGYFINNADDGELFWAERFATPRLMMASDTLTIRPRMKLTTFPAS